MSDFENTEPTVSKYREISRDVWVLFVKYLHASADLTTFADAVHELDGKYLGKGDPDAYRFMQKLLKVYFDELRVIKG